MDPSMDSVDSPKKWKIESEANENVNEVTELTASTAKTSSLNLDTVRYTSAEVLEILDENFVTNFTAKAIQTMKDHTGFSHEKQYSGEIIQSMFHVLPLFCNTAFVSSLNEKFGSSATRPYKPSKHPNMPQNDDLLLKEIKPEFSDYESNEVPQLDEPLNSNGDDALIGNNTGNSSEESTQVAPAKDEPNMEIDVDALLSETSSDSSSDEEAKGEARQKKKKIKKGNDDSDNLQSISIHIPNIDKELGKQNDTSSDTDQDLPNGDADLESNLCSDEPKLADVELDELNGDNKTGGENEATSEQSAFFDCVISPSEDNPINGVGDHHHESEDADSTIEDPFINNFSQNDLDDIFDSAVTGLGDGDINPTIDSSENSDSESDILKDIGGKDQDDEEKCFPNSDQASDHSESDSEGNSMKKSIVPTKIDKCLKKIKNGLASSDSEANETRAVKEETLSRDNSNSTFNEESDNEDDLPRARPNRSRKRLFKSDDDDSSHKNSIDDERVNDSTDSDVSSKSQVYGKGGNKRKRKRVVRQSDNDEDDDKKLCSDSDSDSSPNKSRKKLRKLLSPNRLTKETKNAEKAERERRKRIEEKQRLYNQLASEKAVQSFEVGQVVLDIDKKTKEILVEVNRAFVKSLKPHQVDGIRFLFDCTIESVERLEKNNHSSGGILAHSMGLGKTFQVIAFLHTIMTNVRIKEKIKSVLIIVPYNVIKNWAIEFDKWFEECGLEQEVPIYSNFCTEKANNRHYVLKSWQKSGGILLITINLFGSLTKGKGKGSSKITAIFKECLLDPGPDMVIIDEGHLLKNDQGAFNRSVSQVKTLRRVILTGTPLQNNLSEYFTMVNFVKPMLLGTKSEFRNRFEHPIKNGQHIDSTEYDVQIMKKRVHILHKLLKDCIHRRDYNVLVPYLQPKFEYVLSLRLTETQIKMYRHYLENIVDKSLTNRNLFQDWTILGYIWNHPALLREHYQRKLENAEEEEDEVDSMDDFIVSGSESSASDSVDSADSCDEVRTKKKNKLKKKQSTVGLDNSNEDSDIELVYQKVTRSTPKEEKDLIELKDIENGRPLREGTSYSWFEQFMPDEAYSIELSIKFSLMITILEKCETIGDKILIFSQSLFNLNLIEKFLRSKMTEYNDKYGADVSYDDLVTKTGGVSHRWIPTLDYFRIDGQVNSQNRSNIVEKFNDPENHRARLMLVSTKAGGIGINLIGANRCIIFDASWNPSNDMQAIFRIFRYGQIKPVYVYRFTAWGTMESKIYERQVQKQSLSHRVVDEQQIQRHFKSNEISELYAFNYEIEENRERPNVPKDTLLADIFLEHKDFIVKCHEHDSLLENRPDEELTEEERNSAWNEYEKEKEGGHLPAPDLSLLYLSQFNPAVNSPRFPAMQNSPMGIANTNFLQHFLVQQQLQKLQNEQRMSLLAHPPNNHLASPNFGTTSQYPPLSNGNSNQQQLDKNNLSVAEHFILNAKNPSYHQICKGFQANINLCTIMEFEDKNLDCVEKQVDNLLTGPREMPIHDYTYQYLQKCLSLVDVFITQLKKLHMPTVSSNTIYFKLIKSQNSLQEIHKEFMKKYKDKLPMKSMPSSRQGSRRRGSASTSSTTAELITISDDDM